MPGLQTVVDTYPLYSKSDQALLAIGDSYSAVAHGIQNTPNLPGALKERMRAVYQDKAAAAYSRVITRYPMAPHVEDARDRLVAMNRPVPEPSQDAVAENDAEERSRQPLHFTDRTLDVIKHSPTVVEAVHVGEPTLDDPKRTYAADITKQNVQIYADAYNAGRPAAPAAVASTTGANEPPRSDHPSDAPLQLEAPAGGTGISAQVINAPAADPNAVIKSVGPDTAAIPAAEKPAEAPIQLNEIKPGTAPATSTINDKTKKPKVDSGEESSSKKKKKKGLAKLNPF